MTQQFQGMLYGERNPLDLVRFGPAVVPYYGYVGDNASVVDSTITPRRRSQAEVDIRMERDDLACLRNEIDRLICSDVLSESSSVPVRPLPVTVSVQWTAFPVSMFSVSAPDLLALNKAACRSSMNATPACLDQELLLAHFELKIAALRILTRRSSTLELICPSGNQGRRAE
jgi:hypothetical protein